MPHEENRAAWNGAYSSPVIPAKAVIYSLFDRKLLMSSHFSVFESSENLQLGLKEVPFHFAPDVLVFSEDEGRGHRPSPSENSANALA
jgi:hypothetical protein